MEYSKETKGYGKKSIWKWIGLYILIGAIVYAAGFLIYREVKDGVTDDLNTTESTGLY